MSPLLLKVDLMVALLAEPHEVAVVDPLLLQNSRVAIALALMNRK
jgi:hypothetical protein